MDERNITDNTKMIMKAKGVSIRALAERISMSSASLSKILNNKVSIKTSNLIKISKALEVPLENFFADTPRLHQVRFRTQKVMSAREKAQRGQILRDSALWMSDYTLLESLTNEKLSSVLTSHEFSSEPIEAAAELRKMLNLSETCAICDAFSALVEQCGIKLRLYPYGLKKSFGLSIGVQDDGPAIVVNNDPEVTVERQIFTIVHEIGHLILHHDSFQLEESLSPAKEESDADLFAGNFLLPDEALRSQWKAKGALSFVDRVLAIKLLYKISYMVVLSRYTQLFSPEFNVYAKFASDFAKEYSHDLRNHYEPFPLERPAAIESRLPSLAKKAFLNEKLSFSRVQHILGLDIEQARELVWAWKEL
ncbi:MAG: XRE family transcriptional regulator [Sphaerochaeta sp.]